VSRTAQSKAALAVTLVLLCSAAATFLPVSNATGSGPGSLTGVSGLESYFTNLWNPNEGLISVGTQTSCNGACGGVQFAFRNGTAAPIFPPGLRFLPLENWADAAAFQGLGFRPDIYTAIYNSLQGLETSVAWSPPNNREAQWGYIISYGKPNTNIAFTTPQGKNLKVPGTGEQLQLDQALPWNTAAQSLIPFDSNPNNARGCGQFIDETMFQAMNFYIRGDTPDAKANLQCIANQLALNSDGSVLIGPSPARGMYLGTFLEAAEVIGTPVMPSGITLASVQNTIWCLQNSDGGISRSYSACNSSSSTNLGSDDETTNAALLAFSPGVIANVKAIAASGIYNLQSVPAITPQLGGGSGTTTTTTSASSSSSSTSSGSTSTTMSTTTSSSSIQTNSTTSTTSATSTLTTGTSISTSSATVTTSYRSTTTKSTDTASNPNGGSYSLQIVGGCSVSGEGTYASGQTATVTSLGVCGRDNGTGSRVVSWSLDGGTEQSVSFLGQIVFSVLMNQNQVITFNDVVQHQLTLDYGASISLLSITPPSIKGDNYWYDSGQAVAFTGRALSGATQVVGWSIDDGPLAPISEGSQFTVTIPNMNVSHVIHVAISTSSNGCGTSSSCNNSPPAVVYFDTNEPGNVTISVDGVPYPATVSFSWPISSSHIVNAPTPLQSSASKATFSGWQGTVNSTDPSLRFMVNGTTRLSLEYRVQYMVRLSFDDYAGNQVSPDNVTLDGASSSVTLPSNYTAWLNYGSKYILASAVWQGTEVAGTSATDEFVVDAASQYVLPLMIYPQTIKVEDPYSLPLAGVSVQISTVGGQILTSLTDSGGVATFDVPLGVYYATADFLGISSTVWQGTVGSHTLTLTIYLSYAVLGTMIPLVILPILLLIRHRRNQVKVVHEIWFRRGPSRASNQRPRPVATNGTD